MKIAAIEESPSFLLWTCYFMIIWCIRACRQNSRSHLAIEESPSFLLWIYSLMIVWCIRTFRLSSHFLSILKCCFLFVCFFFFVIVLRGAVTATRAGRLILHLVRLDPAVIYSLSVYPSGLTRSLRALQRKTALRLYEAPTAEVI